MNTQYKSYLTLTKKGNNYEKIIKLQFNNDCICNDVYN